MKQCYSTVVRVKQFKYKDELYPFSSQRRHVSGGFYLLPAAVTTELGSSVFQSRPSLEHRSWLSLEPATTDTSFSTSRNTDGSMLTYAHAHTHTSIPLAVQQVCEKQSHPDMALIRVVYTKWPSLIWSVWAYHNRWWHKNIIEMHENCFFSLSRWCAIFVC